MWVMFGAQTKVRPIKGGKRVKRRCPDCGDDAMFIECVERSKFTAFFVLELFEDEDTVFVCSSCREAMYLERTLEPELTEQDLRDQAREEQRQEKRRKREEAKAAARQAKEAVRAAKLKALKDKQLDAELAALKARMYGD